MELILVGLDGFDQTSDVRICINETDLEIPELCESFTTVIQFASEWLLILMHQAMGSKISSLGKGFLTDVAFKWSFSGMSTLVCLRSSQN